MEHKDRGTYPGGSKGSWNRALHSPPPNSKVVVAGTTYYIDHVGRTDRVCAVLSSLVDTHTNKRLRNEYQQRKAGKRGGAGYDGGHLVATRFGGTGHGLNVVPMLASINRRGGAWFALEEEWARLISLGYRVSLTIEINYNGDAPLVPREFCVAYRWY